MTVRCFVLGLAAVAASLVAPPMAVAQPAPAFPADARLAFVDFERVAATSAQGRAAVAQLETLRNQQLAALGERNAQLQSLQTRLVEGAAALTDQGRAQLQREIERAQVDLERFAQDADAEIEALQRTLLGEFQQKVAPIVLQLAQEKGLHAIFDVSEAGLAWANPALDISAEVVARLDAAAGGGGNDDASDAPGL